MMADKILYSIHGHCTKRESSRMRVLGIVSVVLKSNNSEVMSLEGFHCMLPSMPKKVEVSEQGSKVDVQQL